MGSLLSRLRSRSLLFIRLDPAEQNSQPFVGCFLLDACCSFASMLWYRQYMIIAGIRAEQEGHEIVPHHTLPLYCTGVCALLSGTILSAFPISSGSIFIYTHILKRARSGVLEKRNYHSETMTLFHNSVSIPSPICQETPSWQSVFQRHPHHTAIFSPRRGSP